jgi:hypothetical protein
VAAVAEAGAVAEAVGVDVLAEARGPEAVAARDLVVAGGLGLAEVCREVVERHRSVLPAGAARRNCRPVARD